MGDVQTIIRWEETNGSTYRVQTYQKPGSAHWALVVDCREAGGKWDRVWGAECRGEPSFVDALTEIPSDTVGVHE